MCAMRQDDPPMSRRRSARAAPRARLASGTPSHHGARRRKHGCGDESLGRRRQQARLRLQHQRRPPRLLVRRQPVLVRPGRGDRHQRHRIVAGRRWQRHPNRQFRQPYDERRRRQRYVCLPPLHRRSGHHHRLQQHDPARSHRRFRQPIFVSYTLLTLPTLPSL